MLQLIMLLVASYPCATHWKHVSVLYVLNYCQYLSYLINKITRLGHQINNNEQKMLVRTADIRDIGKMSDVELGRHPLFRYYQCIDE